MTDAVSSQFALVGLPGSGKSRFAKALRDAEKSLLVEEWKLPLLNPLQAEAMTVLCVIDVRSALQDDASQDYLTQLLAYSDGIVMSFMEASDLDAQSTWQAWLKTTLDDLGIKLPRYRWFAEQAVKTDVLLGWAEKSPPQAERHLERVSAWQNLPELTEFCFEFDYSQQASPINLEHLLLGLDASKQNLGMAIWRVQAIVKTTEYVNPVAIEGTPNRWDTYAGELDDDIGRLRIIGLALDKAWLEGLISASQLGG